MTRESLPVEKKTIALEDAADELSVGDRVNCAYMSTIVTKGKGKGIAVATGNLESILTIFTLYNRNSNRNW